MKVSYVLYLSFAFDLTARAGSSALLSDHDRRETISWLAKRQVEPTDEQMEAADMPFASQSPDEQSVRVAGFQGRIGKDPDACYSFWVTAALQVGPLR